MGERGSTNLKKKGEPPARKAKRRGMNEPPASMRFCEMAARPVMGQSDGARDVRCVQGREDRTRCTEWERDINGKKTERKRRRKTKRQTERRREMYVIMFFGNELVRMHVYTKPDQGSGGTDVGGGRRGRREDRERGAWEGVAWPEAPRNWKQTQRRAPGHPRRPASPHLVAAARRREPHPSHSTSMPSDGAPPPSAPSASSASATSVS